MRRPWKIETTHQGVATNSLRNMAIMTRELQRFENLDVSVNGSDASLEKLRKDCNYLMFIYCCRGIEGSTAPTHNWNET